MLIRTMHSLILATSNQAKIVEMRHALADQGMRLYTPKELGHHRKVAEVGHTYEGNAIIKAVACSQQFGYPALADDSGLEVDALDGRPGVRSARFPYEGVSDAERNEALLDLLAEVPETQLGARYTCALALALPGGQIETAIGHCPGRLIREPKGKGGFGFDSIFVPHGSTLTLAEMDVEARNTASHRGEALRLMRSILNRLLLASDGADSTGSQVEDGHDLVIMKLGGAVITDKNVPFTARHQVIWRVVQEIHQARQSRPFRLIVVHGGGSYPHVYARQYQTHLGVQGTESYMGIAKVADAAAQLNRIVVKALLEAGERAISYSVFGNALAANGTLQDMYLLPLIQLLQDDFVLVPYGDVTLDRVRGCCISSSEDIIAYLCQHLPSLAKRYRIRQVLICTNVDGVLDANHQIIPMIGPKDIPRLQSCLKGSEGIDVTGGMRQKVERLLDIARLGFPSWILNAKQPGRLREALLGNPRGTYIHLQ